MSRKAKENRKIKKENQQCYPMAYADWKPTHDADGRIFELNPMTEITSSSLENTFRVYEKECVLFKAFCYLPIVALEEVKND